MTYWILFRLSHDGVIVAEPGERKTRDELVAAGVSEQVVQILQDSGLITPAADEPAQTMEEQP
jgi:hypothetical protein